MGLDARTVENKTGRRDTITLHPFCNIGYEHKAAASEIVNSNRKKNRFNANLLLDIGFIKMLKSNNLIKREDQALLGGGLSISFWRELKLSL